MTSPRADAPKLDRLIQRTIRVSTDALVDRVFRFDNIAIDYRTAGSWSVSATALAMAEKDADGRLLPGVNDYVLDIGDTYLLAVTNYSRMFQVEAYDYPRSSWNQDLKYARQLTYAVGEVDPARIPSDGAMMLTFPPDSRKYVEKVVKVWARRTDFLGKDLITITDAGPATIEDTRLLVRAVGPTWAEGDVLIDDKDVPRTVRGVAEVGRHYLELLARSLTAPAP